MHPTVNIAVKAARQAGNIIIRYLERRDELTVSTKAHNDFVTEVDTRAEQAIIEIIHKAFPNHAILAEESGLHDGDEYQWIIDPLDGTTNYLHGFPQFAVSIALRVRGRLEHAVIYDPLSQELYTTSRGSGAYLNNHRIRVSRSKSLEGALLGTGFPFKQPQHLEAYLQTFRALHPYASGIRRAGSAALDLAYVAAGRLDGFWEIGLQPWDMAAGILLIQEAGGLVGDFRGGHEFMRTGNLIAGNAKVFKAILQTIRPCLTDALDA